MNTILKACRESRNGNYCHALEVSNTYEIENAIEAIAGEFPDNKEELKDFFNTMTIIYYSDGIQSELDEENVNNFNINEFIDNLN